MNACSEIDLTRGRFRRIYTTLLTDPRFDALSEAAEALWHRLHLVADDYGNLEAHPALIRAAAAPLRQGWTEKRLAAWLGELKQRGLLLPYEEGGGSYYHLADFLALQPANKNGTRFRKLPPASMEQAEWESGLFRGKPRRSGGPEEEKRKGKRRRG